MDIDDEEFKKAVDDLQTLARAGASVAQLLELANIRIAEHSSAMHAIVAFHRAFDISLNTAKSLGNWVGFSGKNPGTAASDLELEFGDMLRSRIREEYKCTGSAGT